MLAIACVIAAGASAADALVFQRDGAAAQRIERAQLLAACAPRIVEVQDPYYARSKRFHAVALRCALELGLGALPAPDANVFLRARDGYTRPASGALLSDDTAWLAFADADLSPGDPRAPGFEARWEPIDRRQIDPAPYYLVWSGPGQDDPHGYPWPYQLAEIDVAPLETLFPHVAPPGAEPGSAAARGFALFRSQCIACHAINGEGGRVGPDLNVPRSIVEYRPVEQVKAYIRAPESFRYTSMPPHADLTDAELDALIAYFRAMSAAKHDPGAP